MVILDILNVLSALRKKDPRKYFAWKTVQSWGRRFVLAIRSSAATLNVGGQKIPGTLVFADQNPNGKSNLAVKVRRGDRLASSVQWLYFKPTDTKNFQPQWLGRVVDGVSEVLVDGTFDKKTKVLTLKGSDKAPF